MSASKFLDAQVRWRNRKERVFDTLFYDVFIHHSDAIIFFMGRNKMRGYK